jgi:DUF971 family protein
MVLQPVEIELVRSAELRIRWTGGQSSVIPLVELRRACPCAACREERERAAVPTSALPTIASPAQQERQAQASRAELVGSYALRIVWQDGHDTGIYDYALLYSLGCGHAKNKRYPCSSAK